MLLKKARQENGRILILVLITVFTLSAFWIIALSSTGTELQLVGGRKSAAQQFFDAEAGLESAMNNFGTLTNAFTDNVTTDVGTSTIKDPTSAADPLNQRVVADVTIRPIQDQDAAIAQANGQPVQAHEATPPAGSSSGVNTAVTRRYSINAVAGDKELQVGVYRVVPK